MYFTDTLNVIELDLESAVCPDPGDFKLLETYNEGFTSGFYWPDVWKHRPGGPWVGSDPMGAKIRQIWLLAWEHGNKAKLECGYSRTVDDHAKATEKKRFGFKQKG